VPGVSGTATITVSVYDGQEVNGSVTRQFVVTVVAQNRVPTLDQIANVTIRKTRRNKLCS